MAKIDAVDVPALTFQEAAAPATPAATKWKVYTKTNGLFYKDDAGVETGPLGAAAVGNVWSMNKSVSQTLTSNTLTQITFDVAHIDGGGSVIDLVNERFVAPATGLYLATATWLWEVTAPLITAHMSVKVGTTESIAIARVHAATCGANGGLVATGPLSLTSGNFVTLWIHPGGAVTPTARGNALVHLATTFTFVRIT